MIMLGFVRGSSKTLAQFRIVVQSLTLRVWKGLFEITSNDFARSFGGGGGVSSKTFPTNKYNVRIVSIIR